MTTPLPHSLLLHLPVVTVSGQSLGKVRGFEIDADQHVILRYIVRPANLIANLVATDLIITPPQVLSLSAERMVVEDLDIRATAQRRSRVPAPTSS